MSARWLDLASLMLASADIVFPRVSEKGMRLGLPDYLLYLDYFQISKLSSVVSSKRLQNKGFRSIFHFFDLLHLFKLEFHPAVSVWVRK